MGFSLIKGPTVGDIVFAIGDGRAYLGILAGTIVCSDKHGNPTRIYAIESSYGEKAEALKQDNNLKYIKSLLDTLASDKLYTIVEYISKASEEQILQFHSSLLKLEFIKRTSSEGKV